MVKKLQKTDFLFVAVLIVGLLIHIYFLLLVPHSCDEAFYITIPFRLTNGDSLIKYEWHLTQFSSLFSYLPVAVWTAIKGSADSIFLFLRCVYLFIHTSITVFIYGFFRKYKSWAVIASIMFYLHVPYRILAISYQSVFATALLLFALCLVAIYQKQSSRFYIFAGICFGCCCVCNPLFCFAIVFYILALAIWSIKNFGNNKDVEQKTKKGKNKTIQPENPTPANGYDCFFTKNAVLRFLAGLLIIAFIAVIFYLLTGGKLRSIPNNLGYLLGSSEYKVFSSAFSKLVETIIYFGKSAFYTSCILPIIFIALIFDGKRQRNSHRLIYLSISIVWGILYIIDFLIVREFFSGAVSLPFFIFSTICYWVTEKKNKMLFCCIYIPGLAGAFFQYLAANTHLLVIGVVLIVNNIAGVFFVKDLLKEMCSAKKDASEPAGFKKTVFRGVIITAFCVQLAMSGVFYQFEQISLKGSIKATEGPYAGLYLNEEQYEEYNRTIDDLDYIKSISARKQPVLLLTYDCWMYLHLDRPIATHTTWYPGVFDPDLALTYYKANPKKRPKYIYIESADPKSSTVTVNMSLADELFEYTREDLSNGVLLIVKGYKY